MITKWENVLIFLSNSFNSLFKKKYENQYGELEGSYWALEG